jgi:hypothetical protein
MGKQNKMQFQSLAAEKAHFHSGKSSAERKFCKM